MILSTAIQKERDRSEPAEAKCVNSEGKVSKVLTLGCAKPKTWRRALKYVSAIRSLGLHDLIFCSLRQHVSSRGPCDLQLYFSFRS